MSDKKEFNSPNLVNVQFGNLDIPEFKEVKGKGYIKCGDKNDYAKFLIDLYDQSELHQTIVNAKSTYISGKGLNIKEGYTNFLIDNPNPTEDLYSIIKKCIKDIEIFGGFYLEIYKNKAKNGIAEIYHLNYSSIRSNIDNSEFYYSDNWLTKEGKENYNAKILETLSPYSPDNNDKKQIYFYKTYRPDQSGKSESGVYAKPCYMAGIKSIFANIEIANFNQKAVTNGFNASKMFIFKEGKPSQEMMEATERKVKAKFTGTNAANSFLMYFVNNNDETPTIENIESENLADKYLNLSENIKNRIAVAHQLTSLELFSNPSDTFFSRNQLIDAYQLFTVTYVSPAQNVIEKLFSEILGEKDAIKIDKLDFLQREFSEQTLLQVLTKDEIREMLGKEPLTKQVVSNVADSLNSLSPLLATKVLNELTKNEIRDIIGKEPINGGDITSEPQADISNSFNKIERFELTKDEETIKNLLQLNPTLNVDDISKFTKLNKNYVNEIKEKITRYL